QRTRGAGRIIGVRRHSRPYSFAGLRGRRGLLTSQPWRDDRVLRAARDLVGPCSRRWGAPKLGSVPLLVAANVADDGAQGAHALDEAGAGAPHPGFRHAVDAIVGDRGHVAPSLTTTNDLCAELLGLDTAPRDDYRLRRGGDHLVVTDRCALAIARGPGIRAA